MEQCFYENRMNEIDIFNNDTYCLQETFKWFSKCKYKKGAFAEECMVGLDFELINMN